MHAEPATPALCACVPVSLALRGVFTFSTHTTGNYTPFGAWKHHCLSVKYFLLRISEHVWMCCGVAERCAELLQLVCEISTLRDDVVSRENIRHVRVYVWCE